MSARPKSQLLGVFLGCLVPGLGQIYGGKALRGWAMAVGGFFLYTLAAWLLFSPALKIGILSFGAVAACLAFFLYVIIDAYSVIKEYNKGVASGAPFVSGFRRGTRVVAAACLVLLFNPVSQACLAVSSFTGQSESMEPAVYSGERLFVDPAAYRMTGLHRGDLIVYRVPGEDKLFMHRIVGLPGELVEISGQALLVDGAALKEPWAARQRYYNRGDFGRKGQAVRVPGDCYFVLGDYSSRSYDSRFTGFIAKKNVVGRAFKRYYPFSRSGGI